MILSICKFHNISLSSEMCRLLLLPPTKPYQAMLGKKEISLRQKTLQYDSIPALFFLDIFPFCVRLIGNV